MRAHACAYVSGCARMCMCLPVCARVCLCVCVCAHTCLDFHYCTMGATRKTHVKSHADSLAPGKTTTAKCMVGGGPGSAARLPTRGQLSEDCLGRGRLGRAAEVQAERAGSGVWRVGGGPHLKSLKVIPRSEPSGHRSCLRLASMAETCPGVVGCSLEGGVLPEL